VPIAAGYHHYHATALGRSDLILLAEMLMIAIEVETIGETLICLERMNSETFGCLSVQPQARKVRRFNEFSMETCQ